MGFIKKHKKLTIFLAIVLILGIWIFTGIQKQLSALPVVETVTLTTEDLINSVNIDGVVESEESKKIFTQMTLPVDKNLVEVGDVVKKGDVLCELDTRTIEENIKQQKASAGSTAAINNNSIEISKKQLEKAEKDLEGNYNSQIAQAEQGVLMAEQQLNAAEVGYEGAVHSLQEYRKVRRESGIYDDEGDMSLSGYENARDSAYASYETAKESLVNAKETLEVTKNSVKRQIEGYQDNITTSQVAAGSTSAQWVSINNLEGDIARATITAPIDGVVTAVYVTEGSSATGLLYVVEDLSTLKVTAALKEYDLNLVKEGNPVNIKSDATGDDLFEGKVEKIAPTTSKTQTGDNVVGTGEFSTEISVEKAGLALKVGTKARVDIIYEKKEAVRTVAFDALGTDGEGRDVVFLLEAVEGEEGVYITKAVPVEVGLEGDFSVEIISDSLKDGDLVVKTAKDITDGMKVNLLSDLMATFEGNAADSNAQTAGSEEVKG